MKDMYSLAKEVVARSVTVPGVQMIRNNDKWLFSPAYDLLNVKIVLPKDDEETALLLGGKKKNLNKKYFQRFAVNLQLNGKQINSVFDRISNWYPKAEKLIQISFLSDDYKKD